MLSDGHYSAWYRIPGREGTGILQLEGGRLSGRDVGISYFGSYVQNGNTFTAQIRTRRQGAGPPTIFGIDELDIEVFGRSEGRTASCKGIVKQRPDVPFDVVLVRIES